MSVVLAPSTQDFAHQVSSFTDSQDFFNTLGMDSSRIASTRVVSSTSDNSCSSSESPRNDETESYNFNSEKGFQPRNCEYVDCLLERTKPSPLLNPSPAADYESDYNCQKDSVQSRLSATESEIGVIERPGENGHNSLCKQPSDPSDKESFQKAPCSRSNCRYDGASESGNILFVAGLNPEATVSHLVDLFGGREVLKSNYNGEPDVHIHLDRMTGKSRGQATVAFRTPDLAQSAIKQLNDREYFGGRLSVQPYRKKNWSQRRGPGFGYVREHLPCRCCDWSHHPVNDVYMYPDTRLSSRSYHGDYQRMSGYHSDAYARMPCRDSYFEGSYPRSHSYSHRDDFQFHRYAPEMRIPETNSVPYFHCHQRNNRPCWNGYQRNSFSMDGYGGGFSRRQNNSPRDYYPRSIYGRGRVVSESERPHKSWKMDIPPLGGSNNYGERYSCRAP